MTDSDPARARLTVTGVVQGVGFRPFVFRLATSLGMAGFVRNDGGRVVVEVEGRREALAWLIPRLRSDAPLHAAINDVACEWIAPLGAREFRIAESAASDGGMFVLPDLAICDDCRRELLDPADRRYRYPFIVCTQCGPRWSIIDDLPYDRARTSMRGFAMCAACRAEYDDPASRRFHAEPIACPDCGPQLELFSGASRGRKSPVSGSREVHEAQTPGNSVPGSPLELASTAVLAGQIVAVQGLGGFHLIADATNADTVQLLRDRKRRPQKPFALMVESLDAVRELCDIDPAEAALLAAPPAPIVLLRKRDTTAIADNVAPGNTYLGVMLPYTPLHILLLAAIGRPIVCTSGNLSDEPIQFQPLTARVRLAHIADAFLTHNRPIRRPVDDSVAHVIDGEPVLLRRARGYAPLPIGTGLRDALALGAHEKVTVAIASGGRAMISPHIGLMDSADAMRVHGDACQFLRHLSRSDPQTVVHDAHPDFLTTQIAQASGARAVAVQHHVAHLLAAVVEHNLSPPVLGVVWDGTGYGDSEVPIRGSEFLRWDADHHVTRLAALTPFPLPGGEAAVREPRRSAAGLLHALGIAHDSPWQRVLAARVNAPLCSSMGRLFDAVASLLGLCDVNTHEAEAASALQFAAMRATGDVASLARIALREFELDPTAMIQWLIASDTPVESRALAFHHALVDCIADVAARHPDCRTVVLTGGCFQNRLLLALAADRLRAIGRQPVWPRLVPCNDGGISLGQLAAVSLLQHF
ncbi:MAG: carbamoyltransferase HypF [Planctomycetota bacterium]